MRSIISVAQLSPADAVTVTEKIQSSVTQCEQEHGEDAVASPVQNAVRGLVEASRPLNDLGNIKYEDRRAVDIASDRVIGCINTTCEARINAYEQNLVELDADQKAELDAAQTIRDQLFPAGTTYLKGRWSEQYGETEILLARADQPELTPHLERLGLTPLFTLLSALHEIYGDRMGFTRVNLSEERGPLGRWHEALEAYLAAVVFSHRADSVLRQKLLIPYESTIQQLRRNQRRRSAAESSAE